MRGIVRGALTAAVTTVALTASLGSYAAAAPASPAAPATAPVRAPAAASVGSAVVPSSHCSLAATTADPDGQLYEQNFDADDYSKAPFAERIYTAPAQLTAMAGTSVRVDQQYRYYRQFGVRTDRLVFGTTHYNTQKQTKAYTEKKFGTGWGAVTKLVDASDPGTGTGSPKAGYLYAISKQTGNLARFRVDEKTLGSPTVAAAGAKSGFGSVTAMTLAFQYKDWQPENAVDGILMTTSSGRLYLVTAKRSGSFAPRLILLRGSTWHFDGLALNNCGPDSWVLLATDHHADTAVSYEVFSYRGTATKITRLAKVPAAWDAKLTTSFWDLEVPSLNPLTPLPR